MIDHRTSKLNIMPTGYFGKLPTQGDFVSVGLDHVMVSALDDWFRHCVRESQKALGRKWLDLFLASPVWRGVAARDLLHTDPVMMIMVPSVDRVGRYFPLVLAARFRGHDHDLLQIPQLGRDWYDWAESAALSVLAPGFTRMQLDKVLADSQFATPQDIDPLPMCNGQQRTSLWWTAATSERPQLFYDMPNAKTFHDTMMRPPMQPDKTVVLPDTVNPTAATGKCKLLKLSYGAAALKGTRSSNLTDGYAIGPGGQSMTVISGLGTHPGLRAVVKDVLNTMGRIENPFSMSDLIAEAKGKLGTANAKMRARGQPTNTTFATSCATLLIQNDRFAILWSGNVRVYHVRGNIMHPLTRDHTDVAVPTIITKALGATRQPNFEIINGDVRDGDRFIICSAALTEVIDPKDISHVLSTADSPQQAVDHLTQDALISGCPLDVAAIAVVVSEKK